MGYGAEVICGWHLPPTVPDYAARACAVAECVAADVVISERGHSGLLVFARGPAEAAACAPRWPQEPTEDLGLYPWIGAGRWWGRRVVPLPGAAL